MLPDSGFLAFGEVEKLTRRQLGQPDVINAIAIGNERDELPVRRDSSILLISGEIRQTGKMRVKQWVFEGRRTSKRPEEDPSHQREYGGNRRPPRPKSLSGRNWCRLERADSRGAPQIDRKIAHCLVSICRLFLHGLHYGNA